MTFTSLIRKNRTSCFGLGEKFGNNVIVVEGTRHAGVLGQLLLDGDTDPALGEQTFKFFEGLQGRKKYRLRIDNKNQLQN